MKINKFIALILSTTGIISLITSCGTNNPTSSISYEESNSLKIYYPENESYLYGNYYFDDTTLLSNLDFSFPLIVNKLISNIRSFVFMDENNKQAIKYNNSELNNTLFSDKTAGLFMQVFNFEIDPDSLNESKHITSVKISAKTSHSENFIDIELPLDVNFTKTIDESFTSNLRFPSVNFINDEQNVRKYTTQLEQSFNNSITLKNLSFEGYKIEKYKHSKGLVESKTYLNDVDTAILETSISHNIDFDATKSKISSSINGNIPYMHCNKIDGTNLIIPINTYSNDTKKFTPLLNTSYKESSIFSSLDLNSNNIRTFGVL